MTAMVTGRILMPETSKLAMPDLAGLDLLLPDASDLDLRQKLPRTHRRAVGAHSG